MVGVLGVSRMRKRRWALKSALASGLKAAIEFQVAAQLLGQQTSNLFPGMSLWRAAQSDECAAPNLSPLLFRTLKDQIYKTYWDARSQVDRDHASERRATWISWISVATILGCIVYAAWTHSVLFELLAIWVPSVVGAVHSSVWRRRLVACNGEYRTSYVLWSCQDAA